MTGTAAPRPSALDPDRYYHRSQQPLQALIFLSPLLLLYEAGALWLTIDAETGAPQHIKARSLLGELFDLFGAGGYFMPGLAVVVILLAWHLVKKDPWRFDGRLYLGMAAESLALAVPLLIFARFWAERGPALMHLTLASADAASASVAPPWLAELVFGVGAGIYEELVFRLIAIAVLHLLLVDVIGLPHAWGGLLAIVCAAVLFASYHFTGPIAFTLFKFTFITAAGIYLGVIYVFRGFGIVAATHAVYDIFYVIITFGLLKP
jgi:membrane protease YdiL (CAAX protease family)